MTVEFKEWPKIPRLEKEEAFFTEKIDGTNACVIITEEGELACQSRKRIITPDDDNFGFARWAHKNRDELMQLGHGYHYGEWWGLGIGRGYDLHEKRFSLFNTARWGEHNPPPSCVGVVPMLPVSTSKEAIKFLLNNGSVASPGYNRPEGAVMYNRLSRSYYKIIIDK